MAKRRHPPPHRQSEQRASSERNKETEWIYGRHAVMAALGNPARRVRRVVSLADSAAEITALLSRHRANATAPTAEILDRRTLEGLLPRDAVHQGVAIEADKLAEVDLETVLAAIPDQGAPHILLLLDQVTDPHNVGAILRSAAAFGALAVIVLEHGAPPITGTMAKAASGALEAVPLVRVTNLARCLKRIKEAGFWCVGLDSTAAASLAALALPERVALVLGAEGAGLRRLVRENCDFMARLPTRGKLSSLNVSNAAAVALYALTQRGA